jgi:hypothetical protein
MGRSSRSSLLTVTVVLGGSTIIVFVVLLVFLAPLGIREAQRRWFFYQTRNNPKCLIEEDCLPAVHCTPPEDAVRCITDRGERRGVCVCSDWGIRARDVAPLTDAGGADGPP